MIKATVNLNSIRDGKDYSDKKELIRAYNLIVIAGGDSIATLMTIKVYATKGPSDMRYASAWIYPFSVSARGRSNYGNYSDAIAHCFDDMGITFNKSLYENCEQSIPEYMTAIAAALGYEKSHVVQN